MSKYRCMCARRGAPRPTGDSVSKPFRTPFKFSCLFAFSALAVVSACSDSNSVDIDKICEGVICDGHGVCAAKTEEDPICVCDTGYHLMAGNLTSCVQDQQGVNPCDSVTCNGAGTCAVKSDGAPICICNSGYHLNASDLTVCEQDAADDNACDSVDCSGNGICAIIKGDGEAICICNDGYHAGTDPMTCEVDDDLCAGVDCSVGGKCVVNSIDNTPFCICGEGYHPNDANAAQCDIDTDWCTEGAVDCGGFGTCMNTQDKAVCLCDEGYHATVEDPTKCVENILPNPCDGMDCDGHGTCLNEYHSETNTYSPLCICATGYRNRGDDITTCIDVTADDNHNNMLDIHETASDQGKDCLEDRNSCTEFCDSVLGYKCSTKCTDDTQCVDGFICRKESDGGDGRCAAEAFETVWTVTEASTELKFPNPVMDVTVNYTIDWGDGSTPTSVTESSGSTISHTYSEAGEYHIKVTGTNAIFSCDDYCRNADNYYLTQVVSFGNAKFAQSAFYGANMLTRVSDIDIPLIYEDPVSGKDMYGFFYGASSFKDEQNNLSRWDTSNVTNMSFMFVKTSAFYGDISKWDTSNVTNMSAMFVDASAFNGDISKWDTSNVTDMKWMFNRAYTFNGDISKWDTSNVTDMEGMFCDAHAFNGDISEWDTSNVTDMRSMFWAASAFNGDISKWDTSNVTNMGYMFRDASAFNGDISKWDTSNVTDMINMFYRASAFNGDISKWDTSNVTDMKSMFYGASAFNQSLKDWNLTQITDVNKYGNMFSGSGLTQENWNEMKSSAGWAGKSAGDLGLPSDW